MVWSDCLHGFALDWVSPLTALNVTCIYLWSWDFGILFEKMLSAQIMWKILMGFTTEADACKPKPSGALPSAATKKAAALPLAAAIREGDIVYGKATKFKDRFDGVKCKVIAIQAQHYKVEILEGPAEGQKHRYLHASVRKNDDNGALPVAVPAGAVDDQHVAAATELPETLPATLEEAGDSLANIFDDQHVS